MSNFNRKQVEFDPYDTVPTVALGTFCVSFFFYLTLFGPILQIPEPLGPTVWIISTMATTCLLGLGFWVRERRKFLRKIRSALNLKTTDKTPYIPIVPFRRARYFEFDGAKSRRVALSDTTEFSAVYNTNSKRFAVTNLPDRNPLAVWDKTLDWVDSSYKITRRRA